MIGCGLATFTTIHSGIALLAIVMMERVQTRRSHSTVGHQRGKCVRSNCVRPSGLASQVVWASMCCECWVILLLVRMVGAPTIEMCAMQERCTSGFAGVAHGFSQYDRVFF